MFHITLKNALIASLTLMLAYAVPIPNSWRSAAPVVFGLAAYPAVTVWRRPLDLPKVLQFLNQEGMDQLRGLNLTMTVVAAGLPLYAIHVLDTLAGGSEARRLNQYQLGELIGSGGMGDVYLAEHRLLERTCAMKLIVPRPNIIRRPWSALNERSAPLRAVAPEHCRDLRLRPDRGRHLFLRHGIPGGAKPAGSGGAARLPDHRACHLPDDPGLRGPG